ncbi:hypothetical protein EI94DRAFT_1802177 [Lactarius quietus]|nr:hypothetical protein EI94DRAFT_1802177 [Lactarius quietus]
MVNTRKSNANKHPSQVVINMQQHRHTMEQVNDDITTAKAVSQAKEKEAKEKTHCNTLIEKDIETHAQRPDLHSSQLVPLEQMEDDDDHGSNSDAGHPEYGVETNGAGDLAGDDDKDPGSAYADDLDEGDNHSGLLDVNTPDIPLKRKKVCHMSLIIQ